MSSIVIVHAAHGRRSAVFNRQIMSAAFDGQREFATSATPKDPFPDGLGMTRSFGRQNDSI
jgi:hypothetical protein